MQVQLVNVKVQLQKMAATTVTKTRNMLMSACSAPKATMFVNSLHQSSDCEWSREKICIHLPLQNLGKLSPGQLESLWPDGFVQQITVSELDGMYTVRISCQRKPGSLLQLSRALDALGLNIIFSNISAMNGSEQATCTFIAEVWEITASIVHSPPNSMLCPLPSWFMNIFSPSWN